MPKNTLKTPTQYLPDLQALRGRNKYARNWVLRVEKKTNRHPETNGGPWGWYEVFPLGETVGYWGTNRDDLKDWDIPEWNRLAAELSA